MNYRAALTRISHNAKTGPIPVSTTEASTCPPTCGQFDTCYAKFGHLSIHWTAVNDGRRGVDWSDFCCSIAGLPRHTFWRHNQAGDLPGDGVHIDSDALQLLVQSNKGRRGFTYTHYPLNDWNLTLIEAANDGGFAVNISCDTLKDTDRARTLTKSPLATVVPSTTKEHALYTPEGNKVVICPATYRDDVTCATCQICYDRSEGRAVIGFPAHGTKKRIIDLKLQLEGN